MKFIPVTHCVLGGFGDITKGETFHLEHWKSPISREHFESFQAETGK